MLNNESMEMYLETILRLCKSNEKVRAVDIANQMRISKVSVCHAIKNLQAKDYVTYESRLIRLTKKGRILAEEIYEHHCELTKLLISLGVDSAEKIRYIKRVNAVGRTPNAKEQRAMMETQRLILRPFEQTDAQDVFEYLKDPQVHCFACMKLKSLSEAEEKAREKAKERELLFAVVLKETGKVIGEIDAYPSAPDPEGNSVPDTFSPCWMLNAEYRGRGYAFEAVCAFFDYLFGEKGARRIYAYVEEDNLSGRRLCERLGMRREGLFKEFVSFVDDENGDPIYENTFQYAILKKEWESRARPDPCAR